MDAPQDDDRAVKTEWAERRTNWAEDRTILASERTFAGWMRTGMASIAVAIGLRAVIGDFEPAWIAKSASTLFILLAVGVFWTAWSNARRSFARLDEHKTDSISQVTMAAIATGLSVGALACGGLLWFI